MGYEENMSFLVIPKSPKVENIQLGSKKVEKIRLGSFNYTRKPHITLKLAALKFQIRSETFIFYVLNNFGSNYWYMATKTN